jgi:predicted ATPase
VASEDYDTVAVAAVDHISDAGLVAPAIATGLGIQEVLGYPLLETLKTFLRAKKVLLVLDNFEHVMAASPLVTELLQACPDLTILVTSRAVLRLSAEHVFAVPPLRLPARHGEERLKNAMEYDGIALFVQRAQAARVDLAITDENIAIVAEICHRLDGLPLAIELAAARTRLLPLKDLLGRLDNRLRLLRTGARDAPTRQETLEGTIDWSYNLLDDREQTLFARMSVFAGGWTVEAAEAVCNAEGGLGGDVLDSLGVLLDNSMLLQEGDEAARFNMLLTIQQYARDRLEASGEAERIRQRHAAYYLAMAEAAESELFGPRQVAWLARLEEEQDNLRAALRWSLDQGEGGLTAQLGWALWRFWWMDRHFTEGQRWMEQAVPATGAASETVRAKALYISATMAYGKGEYERARVQCDESVRLFREAGDAPALAIALLGRGLLAISQGEPGLAAAFLEESLSIYRDLSDAWGIAFTMSAMGVLALSRGDLDRSTERLTEGLALLHKLGDAWDISFYVQGPAMITLLRGDFHRVEELLKESLELARGLGDTSGIASCLERLAVVAAIQEQADRAARLMGAAERLHYQLGTIAFTPEERTRYEQHLGAARAQLDETRWTAGLVAGREMTIEQGIAYALAEGG